MEISLSTGLYYNKTYKETLDILAEAGAKNIEILLNQSFFKVPISDLKNDISARDLNITSVHLPFAILAYSMNESEADWIKKGIDLLMNTSGNTIVTHFSYMLDSDNNRVSNDQNHFQTIIDATEKYPDFNITTENLPKMELKTKHQDRKKLHSFLADNKCYLTYDVTHAATHEQDILEDLNLYKEHIRNIHLSDFKDGNEHKVLGTGKLPLKAFLKELKSMNYSYPVTIEYDFENEKRNKIANDKEAVKLLKESISFIEDCLE